MKTILKLLAGLLGLSLTGYLNANFATSMGVGLLIAIVVGAPSASMLVEAGAGIFRWFPPARSEKLEQES